MYETAEKDTCSQHRRIPSGALWIATFPQQTAPARQICRSSERAFDEAAEGKEVPAWIIFLNAWRFT